MQVFSEFDGWALLGFYAVAMWIMTWVFARYKHTTKDTFLVADRSLGSWSSGLSIAATWIWAPALFVAAQKAYTHGVPGLFWFTVPNILCLVFFAHVAARVRKRVPFGYSWSDVIRDRYSNRVHNVYLLQLIGLSTCSFAVQLLAGGVVLSALTGIDFLSVTVVLALTALSYTWLSGVKASVVTDNLQMALILGVAVLVVPWAIVEGGGWDTVVAGLGGISGAHDSVFDFDVFWSFGIVVTIGLMAGPFGDQSFWQRAFSTTEGQVKQAFYKGALVFAFVPVALGLLGFLAAGMSLETDNAQLINIKVVLALLPTWVILPFTFMLLSGLVSTLDSCLCAVSSMAGHDIVNRVQEGRGPPKWSESADVKMQRAVSFSRISMVLLAVGAVLIANVPGITILALWLFYGTLRASTLVPTIITVYSERLNEAGVFYGVLGAICIGLPMFVYGKVFDGGADWMVAGSLAVLVISGLGSLWISARTVAAEV